MATMTVNNVNFYYELHGQGHPIVLIAGYTCDHFYWLPILDQLAQHFQVLIFDNQGVGQTTDQNENLSAELMADNILALTKALNLTSPHIIGQSMGGTIAQAIATRHPAAISKLAILSSAPKWRKAMLSAFASLLSLRQNNLDFDTVFEATIPWIFGESFLQNAQSIALLKNAILNNPYPQSLQNQIRQYQVLKTFNHYDRLSHIKAPTLVAYGNQDITALPMESHFMAEKIPHAQLKEFDSAHGIVAEAGKELAKELIIFLTNARI